MLRNLLLFALASLFLTPAADAPCRTYENLNAVLWMQTSVEYQAAARQTYRGAEAALLRGLRDDHWTAALEQSGDYTKLPPAVILDLDETVLDNSVYQARNVLDGKGYSDDTWNKWVEERAAGSVPGAVDFIQFAHANGVTPIYITNRVCDPANENDATVAALRNLQLPISRDGGLLCAANSAESDKTQRRARTAEHYRILLLIGDQLGDFLQIPKPLADLAGREKLYEAHQRLWGDRWFQLPNPTYGSWEGAVGYTVTAKLPHLRH